MLRNIVRLSWRWKELFFQLLALYTAILYFAWLTVILCLVIQNIKLPTFLEERRNQCEIIVSSEAKQPRHDVHSRFSEGNVQAFSTMARVHKPADSSKTISEVLYNPTKFPLRKKMNKTTLETNSGTDFKSDFYHNWRGIPFIVRFWSLHTSSV